MRLYGVPRVVDESPEGNSVLGIMLEPSNGSEEDDRRLVILAPLVNLDPVGENLTIVHVQKHRTMVFRNRRANAQLICKRGNVGSLRECSEYLSRRTVAVEKP